MENLLAKTKENGIVTLVEHTDKVVSNVEKILTEHNETNDVLVKSAKLHDIGKIQSKYQDFFNGKKVEISNSERHNIVGWAFVNTFIDDKDGSDIALNILWHHGNRNDSSKLITGEIIKKISDDDKAKMIEFAKLQGFKIKLTTMSNRTSTVKKTSYSDVKLFDRAVLISSDANASTFNGCEITTINKKPIIEVKNTSFMETDRTKGQLSISESIKEGVNLIKAPAGFGKTMIGLLWTLKRENKLIWVCPTNVIAESVYDSIKRETAMLGADISLELFLSGERKGLNINGTEISIDGSFDGIVDESRDVFNSDIVVTNIDNFAKTTCDNSDAKRSMAIYDCDVIFDESHYYDEMECALHSIYADVYAKRSELKRTTILLTATPSIIPSGDYSDNINVLPSVESHYPAVHDKKYEINFIKSGDVKKIQGELSDYVFFSNTVGKTQLHYQNSKSKTKVISHAQFLSDKKEMNKRAVIDNFSKRGKIVDMDVYSSPFLTTGCDYSVENMIIDSPSYKTLFQAIGRINRYGNYEKSVIYIVDDLKKEKDTVFCGENINRVFYDSLKEKTEYTLDELYVKYNQFVTENVMVIDSEIGNKYDTSLHYKCMLFPFKPVASKGIVSVKAGGNKLRKTDSSELFILIENKKSGEWVMVQTSASHSIKGKFDTSKNPYDINLAKEVIKNNGMADNYPDFLNQNFTSLSMIAYDSLTPLPVFNYEYDTVLGVINVNKLLVD